MTVLWVNRGGTRLDRSEMTFLSWTLPLSSRLWGPALSGREATRLEQHAANPCHSQPFRSSQWAFQQKGKADKGNI